MSRLDAQKLAALVGSPFAARLVGAQTDVYAEILGHWGQPIDDAAGGLRQVDNGFGPEVLLLLDARERQQVFDQPGHAAPLFAHDGEETIARLRVVVRRALQGLDEADQRGERRAQFMAGVGDEVDAQPLDPPGLGLIAQGEQRRHDFAVRRRQRRDIHVEQPFDRHALAPLHGLRFAARHHPAAGVNDVGSA